MKLRRLFFAAVLASCSLATYASDDITFFKGKSVIFLPDGRSFPGGELLLRRTLRSSAGLIEEVLVSSDHRPNHPARKFIVEMFVEEGEFKMRETQGAFNGTGKLIGSPWHWVGWSSTSILPDGTRVESEDTLYEQTLVARKTVFNPTGAVQIKIEETLEKINESEFDTREKAMMSSNSNTAK